MQKAQRAPIAIKEEITNRNFIYAALSAPPLLVGVPRATKFSTLHSHPSHQRP